MKRTCAWCRVVYDDGLRWPKEWPAIPAHKNHGICPKCAPAVEQEIDDLMARREAERKLPVANSEENKKENTQ